MAEFLGTENQIRTQKRIRDRQPWIAETPGLANGGRVLHFVEPDDVGWDRVAELAQEDKLAGFPCVAKEETVAAIHAHLGPHWKTPSWEVYLAPPERVLPACEAIVKEVVLPDGWRIDPLERPNGGQVSAIQALNERTGVLPYPAYYSRGEAVPVLTACISDGSGALVATASAALRYHPGSRLAGYVFAGMASVSPSHRRRGLGRLVNAVMLLESQARFGWTRAKEQVAPENAASQAMIRACGLDSGEGYVSVVAIGSDDSFSR